MVNIFVASAGFTFLSSHQGPIPDSKRNWGHKPSEIKLIQFFLGLQNTALYNATS